MRIVGGEVRERQPFVEAADEQSVDADFKTACRALTADLARKYADHLAREFEDDDGLFDAHVMVAALAQVDGVSDELDREADELGKKWVRRTPGCNQGAVRRPPHRLRRDQGHVSRVPGDGDQAAPHPHRGNRERERQQAGDAPLDTSCPTATATFRSAR